MSTGRYLLGAAELAVIATALGLGAYHLRALLAPAWMGALARLAEVVIGISMLILVSELLGALGLFKEVPLLLGYVAAGLGATFFARRRGLPEAPDDARGALERADGRDRDRRRGPGGRPLGPSDQPGDRPGHVLPGHHLVPHVLLGPVRADGHVGPLHFTDPLKLAAWFYPQNSELLHGVGIVFLKTDFLSPLINLMWVALCLLAAWCVGRPYGIGGVTVLGAAVVLDSNMLVGSQAGQGAERRRRASSS